jgi:hypothetical protein
MPRLIITLSPDQERRVRHLALDRSTSMAEVVRTAIDALPTVPTIDRAARIRRILGASGGYRSGLPDVAENHDLYLGEDLLDWRPS